MVTVETYHTGNAEHARAMDMVIHKSPVLIESNTEKNGGSALPVPSSAWANES